LKEFAQETLANIPNEIGHMNCRLFLTHGGLNSLQEAVYHGVPVLGLPLGGDQELNLIKAVKEGYALKLQWKDITEDSLSRALNILLKDRK
jgi:glucuronosyltransferase